MSFLSLGLLDDEKRDASPRCQKLESAHQSPERPSTLPPEIEQLRQRVSEKDAVVVKAAPLTASVDAFSLAERGAVPSFGTFKFGYVPTRGLLYSSIGHELALFAFFMLFTYGLPMLRPQKLIVRPNADQPLVYLPEIGGGSEGEKSPGGGKSAPQEASAAPAHASKGFAYPGAQAILSDPPHPTNPFQTIQRPLLVHPEPIKKLVPLPNIVQMAETRLPSDVIAPKPAVPHLEESPKPIRVKQDSATPRNAKFQVPVDDAPMLMAKSEMPKLPAAEQPLPQAPKIQPKQEEEKREVEKPSPKPIKVTTEKRAEKAKKEAAPPSAAQVARMEMHGKAKEPLLSLSVMPPALDAKIPNGEARGRFAIAPGGTLNPNSITPGKTNGTPSTSPATGNENSRAPNAATEVASNAGTGAGHSSSLGGGQGNSKEPSGAGSIGTGGGSGNTSGAGAGGAGNGRGRGTAGKGAGTNGNGKGAGTGSGGGSGSGSGSFPGITIQGGEDAKANSNPSGFTIEPQTAYAMTVVSTASSGGGLEDFGVFDNERVFTVYVPMKRSPEEEDPTWTMQYALTKDEPDSGAGQVLAPSPVMREWPEVPAELEKKYTQRQVVISAVIDKDGKVSHVVVKQTPDSQVSDPIAHALAKWVFRPAQLNNRPVAVKVLLGIPLS
jgi:hypothetical protein